MAKKYVRVVKGPSTGVMGALVTVPKDYVLIETHERGRTVLLLVHKDDVVEAR